MTPKDRFGRLWVLGGLVSKRLWSIGAMLRCGGNHGESESEGRGGGVVGNDDGGVAFESSKMNDLNFKFAPIGIPSSWSLN